MDYIYPPSYHADPLTTEPPIYGTPEDWTKEGIACVYESDANNDCSRMKNEKNFIAVDALVPDLEQASFMLLNEENRNTGDEFDKYNDRPEVKLYPDEKESHHGMPQPTTIIDDVDEREGEKASRSGMDVKNDGDRIKIEGDIVVGESLPTLGKAASMLLHKKGRDEDIEKGHGVSIADVEQVEQRAEAAIERITCAKLMKEHEKELTAHHDKVARTTTTKWYSEVTKQPTKRVCVSHGAGIPEPAWASRPVDPPKPRVRPRTMESSRIVKTSPDTIQISPLAAETASMQGRERLVPRVERKNVLTRKCLRPDEVTELVRRTYHTACTGFRCFNMEGDNVLSYEQYLKGFRQWPHALYSADILWRRMHQGSPLEECVEKCVEFKQFKETFFPFTGKRTRCVLEKPLDVRQKPTSKSKTSSSLEPGGYEIRVAGQWVCFLKSQLWAPLDYSMVFT